MLCHRLTAAHLRLCLIALLAILLSACYAPANLDEVSSSSESSFSSFSSEANEVPEEPPVVEDPVEEPGQEALESSSSVVQSSSSVAAPEVSSSSTEAASSSSVESSTFSIESSSSSESSSSLAAGNGVDPITVDGNKILFGGRHESIAGMSMFWSNTGWGAERFYNADAVAYLKNAWNAKLVRAAMGVDPTVDGVDGPEPSGAYLDQTIENNMSFQYGLVTTVIDAAIANDMYVIVDWHSHHANDFTAEAITFFGQIAAQYGEYNNVIYEVFNEPLQVSWSADIKPYAEQVIAEIRKHDPDNLIIVGTPTWSQDVDQAAADPITSHPNIAYTLHFYAATHIAEEGGGDAYLLAKAKEAAQQIPLFVTEWGSVEANGDGGVDEYQTDKWMEFLKEYNISHANWSLHDKVEGASALVEGAPAEGGWQDEHLTPSGKKVRDIISNW